MRDERDKKDKDGNLCKVCLECTKGESYKDKVEESNKEDNNKKNNIQTIYKKLMLAGS